MNYKGHLMVGLVTGVTTQVLFNEPLGLVYLGGVLLGSLLPDIDHPKSKISLPIISRFIYKTFGHRGITHTWYFAVVVGFLTSLINVEFGIGLCCGCVSHVWADKWRVKIWKL